MFELDLFRDEVIDTYTEKKNKAELHDNLANPSPANLRNYCLIRFADNLPQEDIKILKDFFDPTSKYSDLERAIEEYPLGKLRALQKFMCGETSEPHELIIKLLAVLIDFEPRPYTIWRELRRSVDKKQFDSTCAFNTSEIQGLVAAEEATADQNIVDTYYEAKDVQANGNEHGKAASTDVTTTESNNLEGSDGADSIPSTIHHANKKKQQLVYVLATSAVLIAIMAFGYFSPTKQCMCWTVDRYVKVSCKEVESWKDVIALDEGKVNNFRKIMRPDTLTVLDINKVWYSKIDKEIEFFTGPGMHPVHDHRSLKAATKYILETYAGR